MGDSSDDEIIRNVDSVSIPVQVREVEDEFVDNNHVENKRYRCRGRNCHRTFKSLQSRSNHMRKCDEAKATSPKKKVKMQGDKPKCRFCPKTFITVSGVYKHQKNSCSAARLLKGKRVVPKKLRKVQEYPCPHCHKSFDRRGKLEIHIKNQHTDTLDHYCNHCGRKFKRRDHFQKHIEKCESANRNVSDGSDTEDEEDIPLDDLPSFITDFRNSSSTNGSALHGNQDGVNEQPGSSGFPYNDSLYEYDADLEEYSVSVVEADHLTDDSWNVGQLNIDGSSFNIEEDEASLCEFSVEPQQTAQFTNISNYNSMFDHTSEDNGFEMELEQIADHVHTVEQQEQHISDGGDLNLVEQHQQPADDIDADGLCDVIEPESYEAELVKGLIQYLAKCDTDFITSSLFGIFGMKLLDEGLRGWIRKKLGLRKDRFEKEFSRWMSPSTVSTTSKGRGRKPLPFRQGIFDLWLQFSVISVDRRDGRDTVRMRKDAYLNRYPGIETTLVTFVTNKRNMLMAQAARYMTTETVRKMVNHVTQKFGRTVSYGTVSSLRPFFVCFPCDREKLECLCITCFNIRQVFDALMRHAKKKGFKVYTSITEYLTQEKHCRGHKNGYRARECITGNCAICKGIFKPHVYPVTEDTVSFYQFEPKLTGKFDKKGRPKKKSARKDYNAISIKICKEKLDGLGKKYMLHRYNVVHDKFMWPLIQHQCDMIGDVIAHMDFSENIKEKPKLEVQPHHFSGEQHSLHCAVVQTPEENKYFFHFSDEKKHDWRFLKSVLLDLLQQVFSQQQIIRTKSDNCSLQYKCGNVYAMLKELARQLLKTLILYFGAAGHGRCLVDGMSAFGVKNPLRKAIIVDDFYWQTAAQLVSLFHKLEMPENRFYKELTIEEMAAHPQVTTTPIQGSRKQHMIVFKPDGRVLIKEDICDCTNCFNGDVDQCSYSCDDDGEIIDQRVDEGSEEEDEEDEEDEVEIEDEDEQDDDQASMIFDMVRPGQVIALRADLEVRENYFLAIVESVNEADTDRFDMHGHFIRKGHKYLSCHYLFTKKEYKCYFQLAKKTSEVLVYPAEILSPFVHVTDDLKLSIDEHQWLQTIQQ